MSEFAPTARVANSAHSNTPVKKDEAYSEKAEEPVIFKKDEENSPVSARMEQVRHETDNADSMDEG